MASYKDLSFLTPQGVEHSVGGQTLTFYPCSVTMVFKLRSLARPLARALAVLMTDKSKDRGSVGRQIVSPLSKDLGQVVYDQETILDAAGEKLAEQRTREQAEAWEALVAALTEEKAVTLIGEMILDSLRDLSDKPSSQAFLATPGTFPALPELLVGLGKANKGVMSPLTDLLSRQGIDAGEIGRNLQAKVESSMRGLSSRIESSRSSPGTDGTESAASTSSASTPSGSPSSATTPGA